MRSLKMKTERQSSTPKAFQNYNRKSPLTSQKNAKPCIKSSLFSLQTSPGSFKASEKTRELSKENLKPGSPFELIQTKSDKTISPFSKKYCKILKAMKEPIPPTLKPAPNIVHKKKNLDLDLSLIKPLPASRPKIEKQLSDLKSQISKLNEKLVLEESKFIERCSENDYLKATIISLHRQLQSMSNNKKNHFEPKCVNCVII